MTTYTLERTGNGPGRSLSKPRWIKLTYRRKRGMKLSTNSYLSWPDSIARMSNSNDSRSKRKMSLIMKRKATNQAKRRRSMTPSCNLIGCLWSWKTFFNSRGSTSTPKLFSSTSCASISWNKTTKWEVRKIESEITPSWCSKEATRK